MLAGWLQPRDFEKTVGDACASPLVVLKRCKSDEKTNYEKGDALARNDVHWAGQLCILIKFFSDYDHSHIQPCRDRRLHAMKSTMDTLLHRSQT